MNPATVGHMERSDILMAASEAERGQQMSPTEALGTAWVNAVRQSKNVQADMLQYAIEALQHAVQWNGIAHLRPEKAKALLDEMARLMAIVDELTSREWRRG